MGGVRAIRDAFRREPQAATAARRIVASWRALSGGSSRTDDERQTLVACSGGADSTALLLALLSASTNIVVCHAVHDMRSVDEAQADANAVAQLASAHGIECHLVHVAARDAGNNYEAAARRLRYQHLVDAARSRSCWYIATGHHADDQLETMLMRLMRGSGPTGLSGLARSRMLARGVRLVRPMLCVERADSELICRAAGVTWRNDATNSDTNRLRSGLRRNLIPIVKRFAPAAAARSVATAELMAEAASLVRAEAWRVLESSRRSPGSVCWARSTLEKVSLLVLGEALRQAITSLAGGVGQDDRGHKVVRPAVRAIRDAKTHVRLFEISGARVNVEAHTVTVSLPPPHRQHPPDDAPTRTPDSDILRP